MIQKDPAEAAKWLKMAAEHGSVEAKERLKKLEREQEQKSLALFKWKENRDNTITITGVKDRNIEIIYVPDLIDNKKVLSLGDSAVELCTSLKEIHLPNSLQYIGYWAFNNCLSLKEIHLPNSLQVIGDWAFNYCVKLKEIHFPDSLQSISYDAFNCCLSLRKIHLSRQNYEKFKERFPSTAEFIFHD